MTALGGGASEGDEVKKVEGDERDSCPHKGDPAELPQPSSLWGNQEAGPYETPNPLGLDLGLPSSRTMKNKHSVFISYSVCGVLLQQLNGLRQAGILDSCSPTSPKYSELCLARSGCSMKASESMSHLYFTDEGLRIRKAKKFV